MAGHTCHGGAAGCRRRNRGPALPRRPERARRGQPSGQGREDFLARAGQPVAALAADSLLWELIQSPLLLSIAMPAYRDAAVGTVTTSDDTQQLRNRLFATYLHTMLTRRRSDKHSARQTVRRLAFLARLMEHNSQTVFIPELLHMREVPRWRRRDPVRPWLICGLAGGLVLGAAGLVAYGWRGALAGAVIGAAVGPPFADPKYSYIDTFSLWLNRKYDQKRGARNHIDILLELEELLRAVLESVGELLDTPGALWVAGSAAAVAGVLFGWPEGLVTGLAYGVATEIAVFTAVILCSAWSYRVREVRVAAPREGSSEVPSPIARAVIRSGVLWALVVALVTSILPGLLVAWPGTSADGYRFAALMAVCAAILALMRFGGFAVVEQAMVRRELRKQDLVPLPLRPFLDYATQCLFLRQVGDGYLFVHLSLLEFFAEMWRIDDIPAERLDALAPQ